MRGAHPHMFMGEHGADTLLRTWERQLTPEVTAAQTLGSEAYISLAVPFYGVSESGIKSVSTSYPATSSMKRVVAIGEMGFPQTAEGIRKPGFGVTREQWWRPTFPFKSSLTGETCQQLADDFEKRTGKQWTQPIEPYALFEVAADVLKRTSNMDDKESTLAALKTTKMSDTLAGPLDWTLPVKDGTAHPNPNCVTAPLIGGQWVPGTKFMFELVIIDNVTDPSIAIQAEEKPLSAFIS